MVEEMVLYSRTVNSMNMVCHVGCWRLYSTLASDNEVSGSGRVCRCFVSAYVVVASSLYE